jgi:arylformamidase
MLYRGYDQAGLDRQYNIRSAVPERQKFADLWASLSEKARKEIGHLTDMVYGSGLDERLDYFPARATQAPVLLFLHGGYWRANDKADFSFIAPPFVAHDISVAVLNYSLAPMATLDVMVEQTRRAVAWFVQNSRRLEIDPDRIFLCGHSAGGHLTVMALLTDWAARGLFRDPIHGACSISGLYDLEPIRLCFLNEILKLDVAAAERNSPMRHLDRVVAEVWSSRELLLCVGGAETHEFRRQQFEFVQAWSARGLRHNVVHQPVDHHYNVILRIAEPESALHREVLRMIQRR